jgi:cell wall-associated NlpC family hydrolase
MDCSGFVGYIYSLEGIKLPRTSRQMSSMTTRVPISQVQKGDLLFFSGTSASSRTVGHVSMVVDTTGGQIKMIHSSSRES